MTNVLVNYKLCKGRGVRLTVKTTVRIVKEIVRIVRKIVLKVVTYIKSHLIVLKICVKKNASNSLLNR